MTISVGFHFVAQGVIILRREGDIKHFLKFATQQTGLRPVGPPYIDSHRGFQVIAESHVSIHIQDSHAWIDCFSCQEFNWSAVLDLARDTFGGQWEGELLIRSIRPLPSPVL